MSGQAAIGLALPGTAAHRLAARQAPSTLRLALGLIVLYAMFFIAGCASVPPAGSISDAKTGSWAGRISLQVDSERPQAFFASFELHGRATDGELYLTGPLGSALGSMRWSPQQAVLQRGEQIRRFSSVDELMLNATGAPVPIDALFDWLRGINTAKGGWSADLSRLPQGRVEAFKSSPAPAVRLKIILDPARSN